MAKTPMIKPSDADIEKVEREFGPLPQNATQAQRAHRYRLFQAQALTRLYEQGKLPLALMHEMDRISRK